MPIRRARLDDTYAISQLFCQQIERWQRIDANGQVQDLPYDALSLYEKWLHGSNPHTGAWMSVELGTLWLSHLLRGAGDAYIFEDSEQIFGYLELFHGQEVQPVGHHTHISQLLLNSHAPENVQDDLIQQALQIAQQTGRITASTSPHNNAEVALYTRYGMNPLIELQQVTVLASTGQSFYRATEHHDINPEQIIDWQMPLGRTTSNTQQWHTYWTNLWAAIPEITQHTTHRLRFNVSGQDAFICFQQHLFDPRRADVFCWTPKNFTPQLLVSIRDWAHREGYRTLSFFVTEKIAKVIGTDAETIPQQQTIFSRNLANI